MVETETLQDNSSLLAYNVEAMAQAEVCGVCVCVCPAQMATQF
jgi:hypothetical protein